MPAIITHHIFGEEAATRLPDGLSYDDEEMLAFLLGNQGPDPYYFCFTDTPAQVQACHVFAERMHQGRVLDALVVAQESVSHLIPQDQGIGCAFVYGLLAHYLLDSEAHAFIGCQEDALCEAGAGLEDAHDRVHALIESELDVWMLWTTRRQTVADAPAQDNLKRTDRVSLVAGTLFSQIAWQVFGMRIGPDRYERCLRDYERIYRTIDARGMARDRMIAGAERLGSRFSLLSALSHSFEPTDDYSSANLSRHPWRDPLDGAIRTASFSDVFNSALEQWAALAEAFASNDRARLEEIVVRGYDGGQLATD